MVFRELAPDAWQPALSQQIRVGLRLAAPDLTRIVALARLRPASS